MANETRDFLSALASRNGLVADVPMPAVQPRLPSRFEPIAPDAGAWLTESSTEVDATPDERRNAQMRDAAPANVPAATAPSPTVNLSPAQTTRQTPATHPALRMIEQVVHERETQTIRVVERERLVQAATAPAIVTRDDSTTVPSTQPAPAQPVIPTAQPQPIQPISTFAPKPPATTKSSAASIEKQQTATPQLPDVHISIGRIEVRAGTAAKKSEPARNKPTAPNLERYLNSLSGAGSDGENG